MGENTRAMKQQFEQGLQHLRIQQQTARRQHIELESALEELDTEEAYKVVGNIMVKKDPKDLVQELTEKLETVTKRLEEFEKQEKRLQEKLQQQ